MPTITIRVSREIHTTLWRLTKEQRRSIGQVATEAIDRYAREQFLAGLNEDYARLPLDPVAWADWQSELASLEGTLLDGIV